MTSSGIKRQLYTQFAKVAKTLASAPRLEILELLAQGERRVEDLVAVTGLPVANVSQHLQHLLRNGLVANRREGKYIRYRLADEAVVTLIGALQDLAERNHAESAKTIERYFRKRDSLEPVARDELLRRKKAGAVVVIDVRPGDEFAAGHIPGAIHLPLKELERRLTELPRGQEIVAYCRGPYCVMAFEAVARLREHGFKARRLQDGFPEWKLARLPVEAAHSA
jgi:rhodanese-related sulfurtransferase/DNA-binding HxlR family transcriptional regulator